MKVLIINTYDIQGGAARAAYRLHQSLLNAGIDSTMLVKNKASDDFSIKKINMTKIQKIIYLIQLFIEKLWIRKYKDKTQTFFSISYFGLSNIVDTINKINPDIVHFHWINGGLIKIDDIAKINVPIVWSLHDMWAFTGGCHYDEECGLYKKSCGNCKVLRSKFANDLSRKILLQKEKIFYKIDKIMIIGLSKWLTKCAEESFLLRNKQFVTLPNPIDTNIFKPVNYKTSRELWNLPEKKKLILFGAMGATSDPRKGFNALLEAMNRLKIDDIEFVVFGSSKPKNEHNFRFKTHYLGSLVDDISLVALYNAVDVMVVPSLQENLSNAIMESLSCGTPVVGFNIGGNSDMIEHQLNGYLAKGLDSKDLANGIEWIINNKNYQILCKNARKKVLQEFDSIVVAKKYIQLYKKILNDN